MAESCGLAEKRKNMMACTNPAILKKYSKFGNPKERCYHAATLCNVVSGKDESVGGKRRRRRKSRRSRKSKRKSRRKKRRKSKKRKTRRRRRRRK